MTSPSTSAMTDLLARVRAAKGPDRNLDGSIEGLVTSSDWDCVTPYALPHYTSSIDAAVALAERVLPGIKRWGVERFDTEYVAYAPPLTAGRYIGGTASSPALALVAALLAALISKENEG